jgi:hypothetical protein
MEIMMVARKLMGIWGMVTIGLADNLILTEKGPFSKRDMIG